MARDDTMVLITETGGLLMYRLRITIFGLLAWMCVTVAAQTVEEVVPQTGDRQFGIVKASTFYRDATGKVEKIESVFTNEAAQKYGFYRQTTVYSDGNPASFEMYQIDEVVNNSGVVKRIDYVDKDDNTTQVLLEFTDGSIYSLQQQSLKAIEV